MSSRTNKILLIVDPQNDFIEGGSLPVNGAKDAMDNLVSYLKKNCKTYSRIYITKDYHPVSHCSFKENGGEWPKHCVQGTDGANIYAPLLSVLSNRSFADKSAYCGKGLNKDCDQYSVFALDENNNITNSAGRIIYNEIKDMTNLEIDVCGIAGDVCVLNTLKDLVNLVGPGCLQVLEKYTASLDDGLTLMNYCVTNNIKYTR